MLSRGLFRKCLDARLVARKILGAKELLSLVYCQNSEISMIVIVFRPIKSRTDNIIYKHNLALR